MHNPYPPTRPAPAQDPGCGAPCAVPGCIYQPETTCDACELPFCDGHINNH